MEDNYRKSDAAARTRASVLLPTERRHHRVAAREERPRQAAVVMNRRAAGIVNRERDDRPVKIAAAVERHGRVRRVDDRGGCGPAVQLDATGATVQDLKVRGI